jgi:energy-coupling factor transporter transmembrane protein EcfT
MALESKGFHPTAHRSYHITGKMKGPDYIVLIILSVLLGVSGWMRWQGIGTLDVRF